MGEAMSLSFDSHLFRREHQKVLKMRGSVIVLIVVWASTQLPAILGLFEDGSKISLKSWRNKYVVAESNGKANANSDSVQIWTVVARPGGKIALKGSHGKYLVAERNGDANANRTRASSWETFQPVHQGGDKYAFKSYHDKYLVAERDGSLNANRKRIGKWERFRVEQQDGGTPPQQPDRPRKCPPCSKALQKRNEKKRASACALTRNNDEIYLVQHDNGLYDLPGGGRDSGESSACAVFRETCEETGYIVEVGDVLHQNVFDCTLTGNTVSRTPEHEGGWKTFKAAKDLNKNELRSNGKIWHNFYKNVLQKL